MVPGNVIGVDVGGTKIAVSRFRDDTFAVEEEQKVQTNAARGFPAVLADVIALIEKLRTPSTLAVGVGVPGLLNQEKGVLLRAPNIPHSENIGLKQELEKALGLKVSVENDAQCFAYAEALMGAGKGFSMVVGITMGTGVGGGIIDHERLVRGANGHAAEIGHMLLQPGRPPYKTDDRRGEVEQFISGSAMSRRCEQAEKPQDYLDGEVCSFLRPEVFREVAWMAVNLTYLIDPSIIIFGGSTGFALRPHLETIKKEALQWMLPGTPFPELSIATLKDAATRGAAALALAAVR